MSDSALRFLHPAVAAQQPLVQAGLVQRTDLALLHALARRYPSLVTGEGPTVAAFALALAAPRQGHVGLQVGAGARLWASEGRAGRAGIAAPPRLDAALAAQLTRHPCVGHAGAGVAAPGSASVPGSASGPTPGPDEPQAFDTPFVWQAVAPQSVSAGAADTADTAGILLTRRMWHHQRRLVVGLQALAAATRALPAGFEARVSALYGDAAIGAAARDAARVAASGRLAVVTGGPGTGKTWGVKRILALLLEAAHERGEALSIALAAPTGKAAVRMAEAMAEGLDDLRDAGVPEAVCERLTALEPQTLHRLLGVLPHQPQRFRHGADAPLASDVVVVDEASMADLVLMRHLVDAVAAGTGTLILLGDRDQLASVDAGTVLADMVTSGDAGALAGRVVTLRHSYRFDKAAAVACVAEGLQLRGPADLAEAVDLLCGRPPRRESWRARLEADVPARAGGGRLRWREDGADSLDDAVLDQLAAPWLAEATDDLHPGSPQPGYVSLLRRASDRRSPALHAALLDALARYRVLAAHRRGARGVLGLNEALATRVRAALGPAAAGERGGFWAGQPVLITRNAYDVDLRNGDVGLVVERETRRGVELAVAFPSASPSRVRYVPLPQLPPNEPALAMTVHKSQGSQFDHVALVLPAEAGSPILTRELVYTGITRARWRLTWVGTEAVMRAALRRDVARASGLSELLMRPPTTAAQAP